jgi:AcrR family transcriptional regulator
MEQWNKHDEKARLILSGAAKVFSEKGYHHASMRDIAKVTGMSLAGMYHYFSGKEEILFSIQSFCFREVLDRLQERLAATRDPHQQLEEVVRNHLDFFAQKVTEMRVLSHEAESLDGEYLQHINAMKREYYQMVSRVFDQLQGGDWDAAERRRAVLSFFGMINWIYTWYSPERDGSPEELVRTMMNILDRGIVGAPSRG